MRFAGTARGGPAGAGRWQPAEAKGHAGHDPDEPGLCASAVAGNRGFLAAALGFRRRLAAAGRRGRTAGTGAARTRAQRHRSIDRHEIAFLALVSASCCSPSSPRSCWCARARARRALEAWSRDEIAQLRDEARSRQRTVAVRAAGRGGLARRPRTSRASTAIPAILGVSAPHRVLAFGTWLDAGKARAMEHAVEALRARGEAFAMTLTTLTGHRSRRKAAPSAAAPCCASRTPAASSATSSNSPPATRSC